MAYTRTEFFEKFDNGNRWNVGVSINRPNALPLDSSSVFESLSDARIYAKGGEPLAALNETRVAADKSRILENAHMGQLLAVVAAPEEGETLGKVGIYYVDQNYDLQEVGKAIEVDGKSIVVDATSGELQIAGFNSDDAAAGMIPQKTTDGTIKWVTVSAVVSAATVNTRTVGDEDKSIKSKIITRETEIDGVVTEVETDIILSLAGFESAENANKVPFSPATVGEALEWKSVYTASEVDAFNSGFATELSELEATLSETASEVDALSEALDALDDSVAAHYSEFNSELDDAVLRISEVESNIADITSQITTVFSYKGSATVTVDETGAIVLTPTGAEAPLVPSEDNVGFVYTVTDATHGDKEYVSTGTAWELLGTACDLSGYVETSTLDEYKASQATELSEIRSSISDVDSKFAGYVTTTSFETYQTAQSEVLAGLSEIDYALSEDISEVDAKFAGYVTTSAFSEYQNAQSEVLAGLSEIDYALSEDISEVDAKFAGYVTTTSFETYQTAQSEVDATLSEAISEVDGKFAGYVTTTSFETYQTAQSGVNSVLSEAIAGVDGKFAGYVLSGDFETHQNAQSEVNATLSEAIAGVESAADAADAAAKAASQIKIFRNSEAIDATAEAKTWTIAGNDFGKNATVSVYHNGALILPDINVGTSSIALSFNKGDDVTFEVGTIMVIVVGNSTTAVTDSPLTPVSA